MLKLLLAGCLFAVAPLGIPVTVYGASWILRLVNSTVFRAAATGETLVDIPDGGPFAVYHRTSRLRGWPSRPEVLVVDAAGRKATMRSAVGFGSYKGVTTLSILVGQLVVPEPGRWAVRVLDGGDPKGTLLFCRPTAHWMPLAIVMTAAGVFFSLLCVSFALFALGFGTYTVG